MSFYNNIFVGNNDFDIGSYKEFMYDNILKDKYKKIEREPVIEIEKEVIERKIENDVTFPEIQDQLFWCIYIALEKSSNCNKKFTYNDNYYFLKSDLRKATNVMMDIKKQIVNYFSENIKKMKEINVKITNATIQEINSDIATNSISTIKSLYAYAIYYKARIVIVKNDFYLDIYPNNCSKSDLFNIVIVKKNKEYGVHGSPELYIDEIQKEYFKLETFENPLKSISKYTVTELRDLAHYFDLKYEKKMDKQTLYRDLSRMCEW